MMYCDICGISSIMFSFLSQIETLMSKDKFNVDKWPFLISELRLKYSSELVLIIQKIRVVSFFPSSFLFSIVSQALTIFQLAKVRSGEMVFVFLADFSRLWRKEFRHWKQKALLLLLLLLLFIVEVLPEERRTAFILSSRERGNIFCK